MGRVARLTGRILRLGHGQAFTSARIMRSMESLAGFNFLIAIGGFLLLLVNISNRGVAVIALLQDSTPTAPPGNILDHVAEGFTP
jgi:hypothetical protein